MKIVYHLITLFPLWGNKKIKEPADIGKTTTIVNQGKKFVVKIRYTWARKTRAQNGKEKNRFHFEYGFLSVKKRYSCVVF